MHVPCAVWSFVSDLADLLVPYSPAPANPIEATTVAAYAKLKMQGYERVSRTRTMRALCGLAAMVDVCVGLDNNSVEWWWWWW